MWANVQRDSRPAEYSWHRLLNAAKFGWCPTPATRVPCSNAANTGERKTWTQNEFCTWQNSVTGQESPKMYISCTIPGDGQTSCKVSLVPLSDVAAVTKSRCETIWNLLECLKITKISQPLVGRRSPNCEDIHTGRYWCLTRFLPIVDICLSCEDIARQSCAMVRRWRIFDDILRLVFSASRVQHVSDSFLISH